MMPSSDKQQRLISAFLFLGGCILVFRAISMTAGARDYLAGWVYGLLLAELVLDIIALAAIARWFVLCSDDARTLAARATALVVILHAVRVGVFVLGRVGPWVDLDVLPAARAAHADRWSWAEVWFAASLSIISIGILVWYWRRRG